MQPFVQDFVKMDTKKRASLIGHGDWEKCLKTGGKQVSYPSSGRARTRTQGTIGWSAPPQFLGRW